MSAGEAIGLQAAAQHLGVHYQTAYQWVRRGDLAAHQVGRQYVITRADLEAFADSRDRRTAPPRRVPRAGFSTALPRFHAALVNGDDVSTRRIAGDYLDTGTSLTTVIEGLFAPALRQIGIDWWNGETTIVIEHRATAIVHRLIAEHLPRRRGRPRGTALTATPPGDLHDLTAFMAAAALREAGWKVHHLGANLPVEEMARFATEDAIDLVVISATTDEGRRAAVDAVDQLTAAGHNAITNAPGMTLTGLVALAETGRRR